MAADSRFAGGGLGELAALLGNAHAVTADESVRACAQRLELNLGRVPRGSTVEDKWQSVILAADNVGKFADLLADLLRVIGHDTRTAASLRAWKVRGARSATIQAAVTECAR